MLIFNNILDMKIVLAKLGEWSVICTRQTVFPLAWASGPALMSNPALSLKVAMFCREILRLQPTVTKRLIRSHLNWHIEKPISWNSAKHPHTIINIVIMRIYSHANSTHFPVNGCAPGLRVAWIERPGFFKYPLLEVNFIIFIHFIYLIVITI